MPSSLTLNAAIGFYFRPMVLLSASGTVKIILILLAVLVVLRMIQRRTSGPARPPKGTHWGRPEPRAKGDVRIETAGKRDGPVEDADFEEVR